LGFINISRHVFLTLMLHLAITCSLILPSNSVTNFLLLDEKFVSEILTQSEKAPPLNLETFASLTLWLRAMGEKIRSGKPAIPLSINLASFITNISPIYEFTSITTLLPCLSFCLISLDPGQVDASFPPLIHALKNIFRVMTTIYALTQLLILLTVMSIQRYQPVPQDCHYQYSNESNSNLTCGSPLLASIGKTPVTKDLKEYIR
jgi:hypothetical protein